MRIIIIAQKDCPKCEEAIAAYRSGGIKTEIYEGFTAIPDADLRADLMAELMVKRQSGDPMRAPIVFENGKLAEWEG